MMAIAPRFWRKQVLISRQGRAHRTSIGKTAANNFSRPILVGRSWAPTMIGQTFCLLLLYIPA
jgi:hypothetical protein